MMKMTWKLAESLMNDFACLAISANGGVPAEGLSDEQMEQVQTYARETFNRICSEWEEFTGKEWDIMEPETN